MLLLFVGKTKVHRILRSTKQTPDPDLVSR